MNTQIYVCIICFTFALKKNTACSGRASTNAINISENFNMVLVDTVDCTGDSLRAINILSLALCLFGTISTLILGYNFRDAWKHDKGLHPTKRHFLDLTFILILGGLIIDIVGTIQYTLCIIDVDINYKDIMDNIAWVAYFGSWWVNGITLLLLFILRLYIVFEGSHYAYSHCHFVGLYTTLAIAMFCGTIGLIFSQFDHFMLILLAFLLSSVSFIFYFVLMTIILILFVGGLFRVQASAVTQDSIDTMFTKHKNTIINSIHGNSNNVNVNININCVKNIDSNNNGNYNHTIATTNTKIDFNSLNPSFENYGDHDDMVMTGQYDANETTLTDPPEDGSLGPHDAIPTVKYDINLYDDDNDQDAESIGAFGDTKLTFTRTVSAQQATQTEKAQKLNQIPKIPSKATSNSNHTTTEKVLKKVEKPLSKREQRIKKYRDKREKRKRGRRGSVDASIDSSLNKSSVASADSNMILQDAPSIQVKQTQLRLIYTMSKYVILVSFSVISTFITFVIFAYRAYVYYDQGSSRYHSQVIIYFQLNWSVIDSLTNIICTMMQFRFFGNKFYKQYCVYFHNKVQLCFKLKEFNRMAKIAQKKENENENENDNATTTTGKNKVPNDINNQLGSIPETKMTRISTETEHTDNSKQHNESDDNGRDRFLVESENETDDIVTRHINNDNNNNDELIQGDAIEERIKSQQKSIEIITDR